MAEPLQGAVLNRKGIHIYVESQTHIKAFL